MEQAGTTTEREATFAIISVEPETVAAAIADIRRVGEYALLRPQSTNFLDVYFDTLAHELQANHWALRVRRADSSNVLTLKGPSRSMDWGGQERSEMEAEWSKQALEKAVAELAQAGIVTLKAAAYCETDPIETLKNCGLQIIQQRELWRRTRRVVSGSSATAVAELAVDRVRYRGTFGEIHHWEVELEALGSAASAVMASIIRGLRSRFGPVLRPWPHSKLATGLAIAELLKTHTLEELICCGNRLTSAAYDKLDKYIRKPD